MAVHESFSVQRRRLIIRRKLRQKFSERECLFGQAQRVLLVRKQFDQFVTKTAVQLGSSPTTGVAASIWFVDRLLISAVIVLQPIFVTVVRRLLPLARRPQKRFHRAT